VLFIITSLECNGAQLMLLRLLQENSRAYKKRQLMVLSLSSKVALKHEYELLGVCVFSLIEIFTGKDKLYNFIAPFLKSRLSSIQCWMYHSFIFSIFLRLLFFKTPIVWHVRHGLGEIKSYKFSTKIVIKSCAIFSRLVPRKIVYNSQSAKLKHTEIGYDERRAIYIPNGFQVKNLVHKPNPKTSFPTFGVIGRIHGDKGQKQLIEYLLERQNELLPCKFIFIGDGAVEFGASYKSKIKEPHVFSFMESVGNQSQLYAKFDCLILPSLKEAFPNVLVEAMLYSKGIIGFKVGDVQELSINNTGLVEPGNYEELFKKINKYDESYYLNKNQFEALGKKFNITEITQQHIKLW